MLEGPNWVWLHVSSVAGVVIWIARSFRYDLVDGLQTLCGKVHHSTAVGAPLTQRRASLPYVIRWCQPRNLYCRATVRCWHIRTGQGNISLHWFVWFLCLSGCHVLGLFASPLGCSEYINASVEKSCLAVLAHCGISSFEYDCVFPQPLSHNIWVIYNDTITFYLIFRSDSIKSSTVSSSFRTCDRNRHCS